jgi:hypothetical protein
MTALFNEFYLYSKPFMKKKESICLCHEFAKNKTSYLHSIKRYQVLEIFFNMVRILSFYFVLY